MGTHSLARWICAGAVACLVAGGPGIAAAEERAAPWFGPKGPILIPFEKQRPGKPGAYRREAHFIRQLYRGFLNRQPRG